MICFIDPHMKRGILILLVLALCLGIVGAVAFCPMKLSHGRTCPVDPGEYGHAIDPRAATARYVYPYGVLWWGSLLLGFMGAYGIVRRIGDAGNHSPSRKVQNGI